MSERRRTMKAAAALGASVLLLLASCTNADSGSTDPKDGSSSTADSQAAGDSTGVTADTIKIGWPMLDQAALVEAGLATDFGDLFGLGKDIVDDWNANGGINGREIELVERTFGSDIASLLPDMQRVCLELAEDEKVFAAVAPAWFGDAVTCLAGDHNTPLVIQTSLAQTVMDTGNNNIFLANFVWEDALRSAVAAVDDSGDLAKFKKIAVFAPLEPGMREAIDNGLEPALADAGAKLAVDGTVPFSASPDSAAIAAVVSRFKANDVDAVFPLGNFFINGAFMTEAEKQGFHPTYVLSDMSEGTDDLILKFAPPAQLDKAIGASWKGKSPDPATTQADKDCLAKFAPKAKGVNQLVGATQACELFGLLRKGLEGAGEKPTRGSFIKGMESIGALTTSGGGKGSFGANKHTMPDQVRLVRFDLKGCGCWTPDGGWVDVDG